MAQSAAYNRRCHLSIPLESHRPELGVARAFCFISGQRDASHAIREGSIRWSIHCLLRCCVHLYARVLHAMAVGSTREIARLEVW